MQAVITPPSVIKSDATDNTLSTLMQEVREAKARAIHNWNNCKIEEEISTKQSTLGKFTDRINRDKEECKR